MDWKDAEAVFSSVIKEFDMIVVETIPIVVVLIASAIATITDIWRFKVYNILTMPLVVTFAGLVIFFITTPLMQILSITKDAMVK